MKKNDTPAARPARAFAGRARAVAFTLAALAVLLTPPAGAFAQGQGAPGQDKAVSRSKVERKNRAPVSKDVLRVKLPKPVETKLDNGLTVLVLEDHRFPVVT